MLPQGPVGCLEYMNCLEATDDGCQWFLTDPGNEGMLIQIQDRVDFHKRLYQTSVAAGHVVQAQKYAVLLRRAQKMEDGVLEQTSQDLRERLQARRQEQTGEAL